MVYLVGAGPGDAGLITVKGLECIQKADVIIYDHLANPSLLSMAGDSCILIYAGKIAGAHHMSQDKINETLIKYADKGNVVRLKGGDPFIFGRGGEEAAVLSENNIEYEIVPGVSSCYAAAEYCGIPVTHRGTASSFHVVTGHEKGDSKTVDYGALARLNGTLVFLMGLAHAKDIAENLIANGKNELTSAAVISNGTSEKQVCVSGSLKELPDMAKKTVSPAVIVIGDAVNERRDWFSASGRKILATGTKSINAQIKNASDMPITEIPLIKTTAVNYDQFCKVNLKEYSHIAFTSANGVDIFFDYMKKNKKDIRELGDTKFAAVGKKTAKALSDRGIFADIVPEKHSGFELAKSLCEKKCKNVLLVRAQNAADTIPSILKENKIPFTDLKIYRTETDFSKKEILNLCVPDMNYIIFSSGSAAKAFSEMNDCHVSAKCISIGKETTKAAEKYGIKIYKTALRADAEGIVECIKGDENK